MKRRVVITGMGNVTPFGLGIEAAILALKGSRSAIREIASFDISKHRTSQGGEVDPAIFKKAMFEDKRVSFDPSSKLLLLACNEALKSANLLPERGGYIKAPLIVGTTLGGMLAGQKYHRAMLMGEELSMYIPLVRDCHSSHQPFHVVSRINILGETIVLNNACASGLSAIGLAYNRVCAGIDDIVIAGGYDAMSDFTHAGFNSLQLVTTDKCRPFDKNRSGLVLGEGAGVMIIEEIECAMKRRATIYAEIIGFGQTSDAYHITKPDPEANGAASAIRMAIEEAAIAPESIDYINAHGTGTPSNDTMETKALYSALGESARKIPVSSTKPFTGHLLGAAGSIEAIFSVIALRESFIPENLNYETPDPECDLNIVTGGSRKQDLDIVLTNSFGFGGSNAAMLLRKFK